MGEHSAGAGRALGRRLRQEDNESQASLAYILKSCLQKRKTKGSVELPQSAEPNTWVTHFTKNDMVGGRRVVTFLSSLFTFS